MNAPVAQAEVLTLDGCATVPILFRKRVNDLGANIAMREKSYGIWEAVTWQDYGEKARQIGLGLVSLGLEPGDVVSVLSENNKEWLFTDLGTICAGGVTNGIYTTDSAKQLEYLCNDSQTKFLFVENEEQLDKFLEVRKRLKSVKKVVIFDLEGLRDFDDPDVIDIGTLYRLGQAYGDEHPGVWDQRIEQAKPDDLMVLIYTSGTTGPPKGAMISHRNALFQMQNFIASTPIYDDDEQLSFLPLCHIAERTFSTFLPLASKATVNFAESPDTVPENIREVSPTVFLAVPRIWEKFYSAVTLQLQEATSIGRYAYARAIAVGRRYAAYKMDGQRPPFGTRAAFWLADHLVLKNVKKMIGLDRIRWMLTGAAPISPDLIQWYMALGLDMFEVYGQTENCGAATFNNFERMKIGTVGLPYAGTEVKISPEGEILLKGPHVFMGYLNKPEKTAEALRDGWLHTGDVGLIDNEGFLQITDRLKDIIITAGGKNITPSEIENQLKFSPYISDAVVIGDQRKYLTCLVMIDHDTVVKYAQDNDVPFSNYASLCHAESVQNLISGEIEKVNKLFARVETIKKFRLIDQLLTAEDDELTPTMKLKRKFVNEKYGDLIESMY